MGGLSHMYHCNIQVDLTGVGTVFRTIRTIRICRSIGSVCTGCGKWNIRWLRTQENHKRLSTPLQLNTNDSWLDLDSSLRTWNNSWSPQDRIFKHGSIKLFTIQLMSLIPPIDNKGTARSKTQRTGSPAGNGEEERGGRVGRKRGRKSGEEEWGEHSHKKAFESVKTQNGLSDSCWVTLTRRWS